MANSTAMVEKELPKEYVPDVCMVWAFTRRFNAMFRLQLFTVRELESAIMSPITSPLLDEIHTNFTNLLLHDLKLNWEQGTLVPPQRSLRAFLQQTTRCTSGSWQMVLAGVIQALEGIPNESVRAHRKLTFAQYIPPTLSVMEEETMEDCGVVLNCLIASPKSMAFRKPMHVTQNIPWDEYHAIVEAPMDLSIVRQRFLSGYYAGTYTRPNSDNMGISLQQLYEIKNQIRTSGVLTDVDVGLHTGIQVSLEQFQMWLANVDIDLPTMRRLDEELVAWWEQHKNDEVSGGAKKSSIQSLFDGKGCGGGFHSFASDVRRIWDNCFVYFPADAPILQDAKALSETFEELLSKALENLSNTERVLPKRVWKQPSGSTTVEAEPAKVKAAAIARKRKRAKARGGIESDDDEDEDFSDDDSNQESKSVSTNHQGSRARRGRGNRGRSRKSTNGQELDLQHNDTISESNHDPSQRPYGLDLVDLASKLQSIEYPELSLKEKVGLFSYLCERILQTAPFRTEIETIEEEIEKEQGVLTSMEAALAALRSDHESKIKVEDNMARQLVSKSGTFTRGAKKMKDDEITVPMEVVEFGDEWSEKLLHGCWTATVTQHLPSFFALLTHDVDLEVGDVVVTPYGYGQLEAIQPEGVFEVRLQRQSIGYFPREALKARYPTKVDYQRQEILSRRNDRIRELMIKQREVQFQAAKIDVLEKRLRWVGIRSELVGPNFAILDLGSRRVLVNDRLRECMYECNTPTEAVAIVSAAKAAYEKGEEYAPPAQNNKPVSRPQKAYCNKINGNLENLTPLGMQLPGITLEQQYSLIPAVVYALLRLEGNLLLWTPDSYRNGSGSVTRKQWLAKVMSFLCVAQNNASTTESIRALSEALLELERMLFKQLGFVNNNLIEIVPESTGTNEKSQDVIFGMLPPPQQKPKSKQVGGVSNIPKTQIPTKQENSSGISKGNSTIPSAHVSNTKPVSGFTSQANGFGTPQHVAANSQTPPALPRVPQFDGQADDTSISANQKKDDNGQPASVTQAATQPAQQLQQTEATSMAREIPSFTPVSFGNTSTQAAKASEQVSSEVSLSNGTSTKPVNITMAPAVELATTSSQPATATQVAPSTSQAAPATQVPTSSQPPTAAQSTSKSQSTPTTQIAPMSSQSPTAAQSTSTSQSTPATQQVPTSSQPPTAAQSTSTPATQIAPMSSQPTTATQVAPTTFQATPATQVPTSSQPPTATQGTSTSQSTPIAPPSSQPTTATQAPKTLQRASTSHSVVQAPPATTNQSVQSMTVMNTHNPQAQKASNSQPSSTTVQGVRNMETVNNKTIVTVTNSPEGMLRTKLKYYNWEVKRKDLKAALRLFYGRHNRMKPLSDVDIIVKWAFESGEIISLDRQLMAKYHSGLEPYMRQVLGVGNNQKPKPAGKRVAVIDRRTKQVLTGISSPLESQLHTFLAKYPSYVVYQSGSTHLDYQGYENWSDNDFELDKKIQSVFKTVTARMVARWLKGENGENKPLPTDVVEALHTIDPTEFPASPPQLVADINNGGASNAILDTPLNQANFKQRPGMDKSNMNWKQTKIDSWKLFANRHKRVQAFATDWFPLRYQWREALINCTSVLALLNSLYMFEQHSYRLQTLDYSIVAELCPHIQNSRRVESGSKVVYMPDAHTRTVINESGRFSQMINGISKRLANGTLEKQVESIRPLTHAFLSDLPRTKVPSIPPKKAQIQAPYNFHVYKAEYFFGGGEPYVVQTLGPDPGKVFNAKFADHSSFQGRARTMTFCKGGKDCDRLALHGNFGYCEVHRAPPMTQRAAAKTEREKQAANVVSKAKSKKRKRRPGDGEEETCYVCLDGGELICCDVPGCGLVYHSNCLELNRPPPGKWECPVHDDDDTPEAILNTELFGIVDKLCHMHNAFPFLRPVDGMPEYARVVKNPIALQQMRYKSLYNMYNSSDELKDDLTLMASNCHAFCEDRFPELPPIVDRLVKVGMSAIRKYDAKNGALESTNDSKSQVGSENGHETTEPESKKMKVEEEAATAADETESQEDTEQPECALCVPGSGMKEGHEGSHVKRTRSSRKAARRTSLPNRLANPDIGAPTPAQKKRRKSGVGGASARSTRKGRSSISGAATPVASSSAGQSNIPGNISTTGMDPSSGVAGGVTSPHKPITGVLADGTELTLVDEGIADAVAEKLQKALEFLDENDIASMKVPVRWAGLEQFDIITRPQPEIFAGKESVEMLERIGKIICGVRDSEDKLFVVSTPLAKDIDVFSAPNQSLVMERGQIAARKAEEVVLVVQKKVDESLREIEKTKAKKAATLSLFKYKMQYCYEKVGRLSPEKQQVAEKHLLNKHQKDLERAFTNTLNKQFRELQKLKNKLNDEKKKADAIRTAQQKALGN